MSIRLIKTEPQHRDKRGFIKTILNRQKYAVKSVLYIESKKGTTRGEHYHNMDNHFVYCVSGEFIYSQSKPPFLRKESIVMKPGDLVFTPASYWHSMEYTKNSVMLALATEDRSPSDYEKDTFRVKIPNDK